MHITQTVPSETIVKTGKVEYIRIAPSAHGGVINGLYKRMSFDLEGDPRLQRLVNRIKQEIHDHDWKLPANEKEICGKTVALIQDKEFFGTYGRAVVIDPKLGKRHNSLTHLKDVKTGELICKEEALVASYTLHKVGIPNDFCIGPNGSIPGKLTGHAFVQTRAGNIVEATSPLFPYGQTLNHKKISDGHIAVAKFAPGYVQNYGGGSMNGLEAIKYTFSHHKVEELTERVLKNVTIEERSEAKRVARAMEAAGKCLQYGEPKTQKFFHALAIPNCSKTTGKGRQD